MSKEDGKRAREALEEDLDARAQRFETPCGDGTMVWRRWGSGDALVLLHGGTGSWRHWIRNIDALAAERTVWAADLPGMGDSASPPEGTEHPAYAAIVYDGLRALVNVDAGLDLVGFSLGGLYAGIIAERLGERVRNLVLVGTGGIKRTAAPLDELRSWRRLTDQAEIDAAHRFNLGILMLGDPASIDDAAVYMHGKNAKQSRLRQDRMGSPNLLPEVLPNVKARVHAIWGRHDITARGDLEERASMVLATGSNAKVTIVEDSAHWVMYEAADRFNRLLKEILASR